MYGIQQVFGFRFGLTAKGYSTSNKKQFILCGSFVEGNRIDKVVEEQDRYYVGLVLTRTKVEKITYLERLDISICSMSTTISYLRLESLLILILCVWRSLDRLEPSVGPLRLT